MFAFNRQHSHFVWFQYGNSIRHKLMIIDDTREETHHFKFSKFMQF